MKTIEEKLELIDKIYDKIDFGKSPYTGGPTLSEYLCGFNKQFSMTKTPRIIVVVDCQFDFIDPNGALFVRGAPEAVENIKLLLQTTTEDDFVLFTEDRHPQNHCSFIENGGQWPAHCVNFSPGAETSIDLLHEAMYFMIVPKGMNPDVEEYSGFSKDMLSWNSIHVGSAVLTDVVDRDIIVCGVAGDYCVLETLKSLANNFNDIYVYLPGVASIDDGSTLKNWMKENNIPELEILNTEENECI